MGRSGVICCLEGDARDVYEETLRTYDIRAAAALAPAVLPFARIRSSLQSMQLRDRLPELRDLIVSAAAACGASNVRVFGSVARGEEDERSDVDFLVFLERGRTLLDLVRLEDRLERLLGRPVDVVTEASLTEPIRSRALREAVRV